MTAPLLFTISAGLVTDRILFLSALITGTIARTALLPSSPKSFNVPLQATIADRASLDLLNIMPQVYDEPIADISIIPTWMVSHLAAQKVKAVMSGEGADELLGGYTWQKEFFARKSCTSQPKDQKTSSPQINNQPVAFYAQGLWLWVDLITGELSQLFTPAYQQYIPEDADWFTYRQNFDPALSPLQSIQKMDIKCLMGELVLTKIDSVACMAKITGSAR